MGHLCPLNQQSLKVDLFLPIFMVCFSLATIWLIPLFGYIVIGAVLYVTIVIISQGFQVHSSQYRSLGNYRGFEILNGDDWVFMAVLWSSWRAIKGKDASALFLD